MVGARARVVVSSGRSRAYLGIPNSLCGRFFVAPAPAVVALGFGARPPPRNASWWGWVGRCSCWLILSSVRRRGCRSHSPLTVWPLWRRGAGGGVGRLVAGVFLALLIAGAGGGGPVSAGAPALHATRARCREKTGESYGAARADVWRCAPRRHRGGSYNVLFENTAGAVSDKPMWAHNEY